MGAFHANGKPETKTVERANQRLPREGTGLSSSDLTNAHTCCTFPLRDLTFSQAVNNSVNKAVGKLNLSVC